MKITINETMFKDQFRLHGRKDQFSYNGLTALYNYLEELFGEDGEYEYDLDVVSLCCDFTEYENALQAAKNYRLFTIDEKLNEEEQEREALQFLSKRTTIIHFDGGIMMQEF